MSPQPPLPAPRGTRHATATLPGMSAERDCWLKARYIASDYLTLPTSEAGMTVAELLSQSPELKLVTDSEDLRPALDIAQRRMRGEHPEPQELRVERPARGLVLVRGIVSAVSSRVSPSGWLMTTDRGETLKLNTWPAEKGYPDGCRVWALLGPPATWWMWSVEMIWKDDGSPLRVPMYEAEVAGSLFAQYRRFEMLETLNLADLGVDDPLERRWAYVALLGLVNLERFVDGATVGDQPLADWARELLAMSAARKLWRKSTKPARTALVHMPPARLVKSARAAEEYAAEVLRALGYHDARVTTSGADGGVDVRSSRALAQVKMEGLPTGRPAVQNIFGIATHEQKSAIFFSLAGYTAQAMKWASDAGVACYEFGFDGSIEARTRAARKLLEGAEAARPKAQAALAAAGEPPNMARYPRFRSFGSVYREVQSRFGDPRPRDVAASPELWAEFSEAAQR